MFYHQPGTAQFEIEAQLAAEVRKGGRSIKKSQGHVVRDIKGIVDAALAKAGITTATGITNYSLDPGLMGLYPQDTPFLSYVPRRISHRGDVATHWKTITNPDQLNVAMGVAEGQRTSSITPTINQVFATYATLGKENNYSFEAEEAGEGFENLPSMQALQLMGSFLIGESRVAGYGNRSYPLGAGNTPTVAVGTGVGTLPAATYVVRTVPLTYDGILQYNGAAAGIATQSTRNNNDGTTTTVPGGSGIASAASAGQAITLGQTLLATVAPTVGAYGYAWYIGTSSANAVLAGISNVPNYTFAAPAAGTQTAASITTDNSVNPLIYDGLATQIMQGGGYVNLNVGALTSTQGGGAIDQFASAFSYLAQVYKLSITDLWVGYGVNQAITNAVFQSTGPVYRVDMGSGTTVTAGNMVNEILNTATGQKIRIRVDPWAPANFALGTCDRLPYTLPDTPLPFWIECRMRDRYQIDWPVVTRAKYFGIYYSGVMKVPAPFAGIAFGGIATPQSAVVAPGNI